MKYLVLSGTFITHDDCPSVVKRVWEVFSESAREGKPSGKSPLVCFGRVCASQVLHASKEREGSDVVTENHLSAPQGSLCVCV